jgi:hypothetical protein
MIEANGLAKRYAPKTAVDDLTFAVRPGVVTGFLPKRANRGRLGQPSRIAYRPGPVHPVRDSESGAGEDWASEEGDQSLNGGGIVSDHLGRAEATWAGLLGQVGADESQRLLRQILGRFAATVTRAASVSLTRL